MPDKNREYKTHAYWENRFKVEESYEWLTEFKDIKSMLAERGIFKTDRSPKVLVVGCGNSNFSSDLYETGVEDVCSIDFSEQVITKMKCKQPFLEWVKMDMTSMVEFEDALFDVVLDKAAMDALVTDEGDPWNPSSEAIDSTQAMVC